MIVNLQTILGVLGIVGNILTILVFHRKPLRKLSYCFYWKAMAASNVVLLIHTLINWAEYVVDFDIELISPQICTCHLYIAYIFGRFSIWMPTLISIDRILAVVYSSQFKILKFAYFKMIMVALLLAYCMLANLRLALNTRLVQVVNQTSAICYLPTETLQLNSFFSLIDITLASIVINSVLSARIMVFIYSSRIRNLNNRYRSSSSRLTARDRNFCLTSVGLDLISFVCNCIALIYLFVQSYLFLNQDQLNLLLTIMTLISFIDNESLFIVNILFNPSFFKEFRKMFGLKKKKPDIN